MAKEILVGIVLYNPDIEVLQSNLAQIGSNEIVLVDNASKNKSEIEKLCQKYPCRLISNRKNCGIAAALNQILFYAEQNGYEWALTFDQDSKFPPTIFQKFKPYFQYSKIGMIAPAYKDINANNQTVSEKPRYVKKCISSGSAVRVQAWKDIGGFDEWMFIDNVDFEFCHRLIDSNYKILQISEVVMLHSIGHSQYRNFLGRKVLIKNHIAFRKYYIARNILYMSKKLRKPNIVKAILQCMKLLLLTVIYEKQRASKVEAILCGMKDGLLVNPKKVYRNYAKGNAV